MAECRQQVLQAAHLFGIDEFDLRPRCVGLTADDRTSLTSVLARAARQLVVLCGNAAMRSDGRDRYALALSDGEIQRHRLMAQSAREREARCSPFRETAHGGAHSVHSPSTRRAAPCGTKPLPSEGVDSGAVAPYAIAHPDSPLITSWPEYGVRPHRTSPMVLPDQAKSSVSTGEDMTPIRLFPSMTTSARTYTRPPKVEIAGAAPSSARGSTPSMSFQVTPPSRPRESEVALVSGSAFCR